MRQSEYSQWALLGDVSRIEGRQVYLTHTCVSPGAGVGRRAGDTSVLFKNGRLPQLGQRILLYNSNLQWSGQQQEAPIIPGKFRWTSKF